MMNDMNVGDASELVSAEAAASLDAPRAHVGEPEAKCEISKLREILLLVHADFALFQPGAVCEAHAGAAA